MLHTPKPVASSRLLGRRLRAPTYMEIGMPTLSFLTDLKLIVYKHLMAAIAGQIYFVELERGHA